MRCGIKYWKNVPLLNYQLYSALEAFTNGETKKKVRVNDEANVFTTWNRLSDKNHAIISKNVTDLSAKYMPREVSSPQKKPRISDPGYENDVMQFEDVNGKIMDPDYKLIILTDMLPPAMCQRIKTSLTSSEPTTTPPRMR